MPIAFGSRFAAHRLELLKRVSHIGFFDKLTEDERYELITFGKITTFNGGQTIFDEETPNDHIMYFVVSGQIEILLNGYKNPEGNDIVATLEPGEIFGEVAILDNLPRSASARTKGLTSVLGIDLFAPRDQDQKPSADLTIKILRHIAEGLCAKLRNVNKVLLHTRDSSPR
ncbi:MAG: cyclic nucleotide-binding domain-containing protein [Nitrospinota bacterium]